MLKASTSDEHENIILILINYHFAQYCMGGNVSPGKKKIINIGNNWTIIIARFRDTF